MVNLQQFPVTQLIASYQSISLAYRLASSTAVEEVMGYPQNFDVFTPLSLIAVQTRSLCVIYLNKIPFGLNIRPLANET